jgi:hypothetical protein
LQGTETLSDCKLQIAKLQIENSTIDDLKMEGRGMDHPLPSVFFPHVDSWPT